MTSHVQIAGHDDVPSLPSHLVEQLAACVGARSIGAPSASTAASESVAWESAATLPAACYVDAEVHAFEQDRIFRQGWVGVGRVDRWSHSGDFTALTVGGAPVVVLRSSDGELRAFANTCSHRAAQVATGEGNCTRLRCPFHFWTYDTDGRLIGAPSMQKTPGFDKTQHGLHEYALEVRHGFVFVSLEESPPDIDGWMGDFAAVHAPWPLDDLVTGRRREFTVECNWKGFAEVFNEYYHLPYVHPVSIEGIYNDPDDPEEVVGAYATHFGTTEGTGGLLAGQDAHLLPRIPGLSGRPSTGVRYTWLFPNIVIATGAEAMWMYEVYPDGPDRCRCAQVVAFPQSTIESEGFQEKAEAYYERFDVAIAEDIPMLEQQHAGQRSPHARQSRFSYLEPSVASFARWYAERLLSE